MQKKVGLMTMMKFAPLPFIATFAFYQAFSPSSALINNHRFKMGMNFDCHAADGSYYMGMDHITAGLCYFTLCYHKLWIPAAAFAAFDLVYYGPMSLGGPVSGAAGALALVV